VIRHPTRPVPTGDRGPYGPVLWRRSAPVRRRAGEGADHPPKGSRRTAIGWAARSGHRNLAVAVDPAPRATIEPRALSLFVEAARRAGLHRKKLVLKAPPADARDALRWEGLSELVEVLPGRGSR
jgi:hypothetical protein